MKKIGLMLISLLVVFTFTGCNASKDGGDNSYTATVESDSYNISTEIGGKLNSINIVQGQEVKQDEKTAQLDTKMYELQKKQATIAMNSAVLKKDSLPSNASDNMIKQVDNGIEATQNAVDLAQLQIDKTNIKSDFNGVVTEVFVNKGEMVTPGMNIAKVINNSEKFAQIYVEESKRNEIKLGGVLDIYFNEVKIGSGKITFISPVSEFTPKNTETKAERENTVFQVKISITENKNIVPGMMVDIMLKAGE
ncbi:biotin/lipoyl-binding protein [Clostridium bowmanii]|uniref:HlyD family secretion protein n=1 Tax=Clostridium bowmanii TaxID=132925 RepID=UPI001C0D1F4B|nr:biotin/lipoyl-binding protein [Clostridium bowmanii]MBU3191452.1 biotin/lipoyl-binding protein [Clostridium bowmanii]MCA1075630.1 biotin/lipoyl-binding protein [Clostridium bowmanii]